MLAIALLVAIYAIAQTPEPSKSNFSTESASEMPERSLLVPYTGTEPINDLGNGAVPWSESAFSAPRRTALALDLEPSLLAAGYACAYPPEPTVRDGTVAPVHAREPPAMVRAGLHADSAGIAAYMAGGSSQPAVGIARVGWFRAMDDAQAGAAARAQARPGVRADAGRAGHARARGRARGPAAGHAAAAHARRLRRRRQQRHRLQLEVYPGWPIHSIAKNNSVFTMKLMTLLSTSSFPADPATYNRAFFRPSACSASLETPGQPRMQRHSRVARSRC